MRVSKAVLGVPEPECMTLIQSSLKHNKKCICIRETRDAGRLAINTDFLVTKHSIEYKFEEKHFY